MKITLNGQSSALEAGQTITDLLRELGYENKRIAVERNGDIVPRSQHEATVLNDGDRLEIVVAVGGG